MEGAETVQIYYICEYCERIFSVAETQDGEGDVQVPGICEECAMEMGLLEEPTLPSQHYYS
jgi:hypothetical protein